MTVRRTSFRVVPHEQQPDADPERLFPVAVESIGPGPLAVDLYWRHCARCGATAYLPTGSFFAPEHARDLAQRGTEFLYVPVRQHAGYRGMLRERLRSVREDDGMDPADRARVLRASCARMIEDVLILPGQREPIECVQEISREFARWSAERQGEFSYLLDMSAHDFYTTTHMLNVGVGCGMLARQMRPGDTAFCELALQGGLLHDLGKRSIPVDVLNKEGKLSEAEWQLVREHPMAGYRELAAHAGIAEEVLAIVRDHHERLDGAGYPFGLKGERISAAARICAVVDVFDAIVAARPYRGPMSPQHALEIMQEGAGTHFDGELLAAWTELVSGLVRDDPGRAVASTGSPPSIGLDELRAAPAPDGLTAGARSDRRSRGRQPVNAVVRGVVVRRASLAGPLEGTVFQARAENMSRGGMLLIVPWAMSVSDVVELRIPLVGGKFIRTRARVVRVEEDYKAKAGAWAVGVEFATPLGEQAPRIHAA